MDTIQALIKHYIESNGYTVYSISQQSGLNRTTLQKILSGQRKITKEIYEKLLPFFALSPIDKEELEQAFLINQIGPERFQTHMEIKRILEMSTSTLYQTDDSPYDLIVSNVDTWSNCMLIQGTYQIVNAIYSVALKNVTSEDVEQVIGETLREVALHMDLDRMFLYTFDKDNPKAFSLRSYFDVSGEMPSDDILTLLPERLYLVVDAIKRGNGCCMLDRTNMTQRDVINLMRYNFRAEIAYPIYLEGRLYGILIFAESKSERIWTKEELRFSQSISLLIQNMLENADGDDNVRNVNKHLIETYNSFHEGIFIRDLYTGYVFFSNKALNDMLGYDLTGGDSRKILKNLRDKFEHMDGVRKDIAGRKITNWCSYVPALDEIMDITEVPIEWLQGGAATMIIMKKAKDN